MSGSKVYWYDDGPWGGCRVPTGARLLYLSNGNWVPVEMKQAVTLTKDAYNVFRFEPVETTALRLEIQQPADNSAGIHEWIVD